MSKEKHFSPRVNGEMWRIVETVSGDTVAYAIRGRDEAQSVADYFNAQQAEIKELEARVGRKLCPCKNKEDCAELGEANDPKNEDLWCRQDYNNGIYADPVELSSSKSKE